MALIVFPAIDLRRGKCVRLRQGEPDAETVYGDDPVAMALRWKASGAHWLHVVNLDGAFAGALHPGSEKGDLAVNLRALCDIADATQIPVQFGGGMRSLNDIELVLRLGAKRAILGTAAIQNPNLVSQAVAHFGSEQIVIGIDARDGMVATHGWQEVSGVDAISLGRQMCQRGIVRLVYTDIGRDGMLGGANVESTAALARETGLSVIASGGVASLDDVRALKSAASSGIEGVIVGKALYTGAIDLAEAIVAAA